MSSSQHNLLRGLQIMAEERLKFRQTLIGLYKEQKINGENTQALFTIEFIRIITDQIGQLNNTIQELAETIEFKYF